MLHDGARAGIDPSDLGEFCEFVVKLAKILIRHREAVVS
jgi:hypothetical protein